MYQSIIENKVQRGIDIINRVVPIALQWMNGDRPFIRSVFHKVFHSLGNQLVSHCIDKWEEDNDFARFYLNMDMNLVTLFFSYYNVPLALDPYNGDEGARTTAQLIEGKKGFDLYPFEAEITRQFYLTGYIHSLEILGDIAPKALENVKSKNIDLYGTGMNWSKVWKVTEKEDKMKLVHYLIQNHDTEKKTSKLIVIKESPNYEFPPKSLFWVLWEKYNT